MAEHKFREFLRSKRWGVERDFRFVEDVKDDQQFPDVQSWEELEAFLRSRNASPESLDSARALWQLYERDAEKKR
jgi:YozE SAM-like fold